MLKKWFKSLFQPKTQIVQKQMNYPRWKVDLHRHVGGSITPTTIYEILKHHGTTIPVNEIQQNLIMSNKDQKTFKNFLSKFDILDKIKWDPWSIRYAFQQICWDIAKEHVDHCELKMSIGRYVRDTGWSPEDVLNYIYQIVQDECIKWNISVSLILALKYEADREIQKRFSKVIEHTSIMDNIDGLDLVGDEALFNSDFYKPIFKYWKSANKGLQAHVGESQSAENVKKAILELGVDRIAHGIKAIDFPDILNIAKERDICFDIALTSNLFIGIINNIQDHPIKRLYDVGIPITIGTDDPVILGTTLDNEYQLAREVFQFSDEEIIHIMLNSVEYAFKLPPHV